MPPSTAVRIPESTNLTAAAAARRGLLPIVLELGKFRLSVFVLMTTAFGFLLAGSVEVGKLLAALIGTGLVAFAANTLNQIWEMQHDRLMARTAHRPLVVGQIAPAHALAIALVLATSGVWMLSQGTSVASTVIAVASLVTYVLVYTPCKRLHSVNTMLGAIPGALPILIGWAAATPHLGVKAWLLFSLVFCWQIPHFMAIAWLYRADYQRAGFRMLSVEDPTGKALGRTALTFSLALVPLTMSASLAGLAGWFNLLLSPIVAGLLVVPSWRFLHRPSTRAARLLFAASLAHLPLTLLVILVDSTRLHSPIP
jgi:protoheme IX farnesyltransferase